MLFRSRVRSASSSKLYQTNLTYHGTSISLGDISSFNYNHLFFKDELCDLDAVVFIDQPGVRLSAPSLMRSLLLTGALPN